MRRAVLPDAIARAPTWLQDTQHAALVGRGSPAALVLSYAARRAPLGDEPRLRRARALGLEYAAQVGLATRLPDFGEGVACALGTRRGEAPRWAHETVAEAAADPRVRALLEEMRRAAPMAADAES